MNHPGFLTLKLHEPPPPHCISFEIFGNRGASARYRPMHSRGVTSFSALIARVNDSLVVRIPLD
jgi:hypothetical protein